MTTEKYGDTNTQNYFKEQTGSGSAGKAAADGETCRAAVERERQFCELFRPSVFNLLYFVLSRISGLYGLSHRDGFGIFQCQKD